jgi:hypothetical protein
MKKTIYYIMTAGVLALGLPSCSFFEIDNYAQPEETVKGVVVDVATGEPVLTEQSTNGIRVRMTELSYGPNVIHNPDFYCRDDGSFQNTKVFKGNYNIRVDGPFIPIVRENPDGELIEDNSITCDVKGTTELRFEVEPFLKVEFVGEPVVSGGKITAQVKVTRAVSVERFREQVEPMGGYNSNFTNVTDVRLFVSYSSTCSQRSQYSALSSKIEYGGASFESHLGEPITMVSSGTAKPNRKLFIRAAARINYGTPAGSGTRRYNYSEVKEVNIP